MQPGHRAGGEPGEEVVAGPERVQAGDGVQRRGGRIDRIGVDGLAEQLSFVPFLGGYQGRVVADRGVAFDSLGEPQQGPDRQVPYSGNRSGYENVPKFMMVRGATSGPGLRDRGRTGGAGW